MVYDVIIAGAGPVGLFLACELRPARAKSGAPMAIGEPIGCNSQSLTVENQG